MINKSFVTAFNNLSNEIYETSKSKGFWDEGENRNVPEMISLKHSELSESLESFRDDWSPDDKVPHFSGVVVEIGDGTIRGFDMNGGLKLGVFEWIEEHINTTAHENTFVNSDYKSDFVSQWSYFAEQVTKSGLESILIGKAGNHIPTIICVLHRHLSNAFCAYMTSCNKKELIPHLGRFFMDVAFVSKKLDLPIAESIIDKIEYNKGRPYKHGRKKC